MLKKIELKTSKRGINLTQNEMPCSLSSHRNNYQGDILISRPYYSNCSHRF
jgi:hypothetical protein